MRARRLATAATGVLAAFLLVLAALTPGRAQAAPGLSLGITEPNPNFLWSPGERAVPEPFARWGAHLRRVRPAHYRLVLDWARLQPDATAPANLEQPQAGCMRALPPCAGWGGVREQLRALAARQRDGGWEGVAVVTGTPDWAARAPAGCERPGTVARSRPPRPDALPAYRQLVADVLALAAQEGARLDLWSAWNEPNHPYFLSHQRARCGRPVGPSTAPALYAEIAAALQDALDAAPGAQELLLGELAASVSTRPTVTSVGEFVRALPRELVCGSRVWAQHAYAGGRTDIVAVAQAALATHACEAPHELWVTETGLRLPGSEGAGLHLGAPAGAAAAEACPVMAAHLEALHARPGVATAFQYTLREDDLFRTGLVTTSLDGAYPVLALWRAWGARAPGAAPPGAVPGCGQPPPVPPGAFGGEERREDRAPEAGGAEAPAPAVEAPAPAALPSAPAQGARRRPAQRPVRVLLATARLGRSTVTVRGSLPTVALGHVTATFTASVRGRARSATIALRVRSRRFGGTLTLPRELRAARRGELVVAFPGRGSDAPAEARRTLRRPTRPLSFSKR